MKILIVDDEKDVEALFRQRFRKEIRNGDIVLQFQFSGEDALDFIKKKDPLDLVLVLSDINMPGMSGLELLKEIKGDHPSLPVMMVTAYGDDQNRQHAEANGADDLFTKPVDFVALKERIQNLAKK